MKQCYLVNPQFGLIAAYMAIVLSLQENIDLLLFLVKLAIALGAIAISLLLIFWFRLKKIEKRIYQRRRQLKSRFSQNISRQVPSKILPNSSKNLVLPQAIAHRSMTKRSPQTQVYLPTTYPKLLKKSKKRYSRISLHWLWAIMLASITGMAIALMQLGNSFISPEYMPIIWLLIGVTLVMSATFIEIA